MGLSEDRETLRYFDEKVDKLESLSFTRYVTENAVSTPGLLSDATLFLEESLPGDESVDAFVLTLRLFAQKNEPISLFRMAALYQRLPIAEDKKALVREAREQLNRELDSYSHLGIAGHRLRQREIFEVFLYGGLAHGSDLAKRERFRAWRAEPRLFATLKSLFVMLLMDWIETLYWMRDFNKQVSAELPEPRHRGA